MDTDYLRAAFREDAQLAGPPPADPFEKLVARRQKSGRRRSASLAAGVAVVLVAVLVPVGLSVLGQTDEQVSGPASIPEASVFAGPTRGSLAGDAEFLAGLTELSWAVPYAEPKPSPMFPNPPVESRHVAFAGEVPSGRWALVVGPNTLQPIGDAAAPELQTELAALSEVAGIWFRGPAGATPDQMELSSFPRGFVADEPASLYDNETGALVVVAAPGDVIDISSRPEVAADASLSRSFVDAGAEDGVAVSLVPPNPYLYVPAVAFRVSRAGVVVVERMPDGASSADDAVAGPDIELEYLRPPVGGIPAEDPNRDEQRMAAEILSEYGLGPDEINLQVQYVGPIPAGTNTPTSLTVLTATFPSEAVLTRVDWTQQLDVPGDPAGAFPIGGASCINELAAAGLPAAQRVIAVACNIPDDQTAPDPDLTRSIVVMIPPGLGASSIVTVGDAMSSEIALTDPGLAILPFLEGAQTVVIEAADGTVLAEVPIQVG